MEGRVVQGSTGPARRKRRPLFRQGVSRVSVADLVSPLSFFLSILPMPLFYLSKERSMAVVHSGNLSLGSVIDTMQRQGATVYQSSNGDLDRGNSNSGNTWSHRTLNVINRLTTFCLERRETMGKSCSNRLKRSSTKTWKKILGRQDSPSFCDTFQSQPNAYIPISTLSSLNFRQSNARESTMLTSFHDYIDNENVDMPPGVSSTESTLFAITLLASASRASTHPRNVRG